MQTNGWGAGVSACLIAAWAAAPGLALGQTPTPAAVDAHAEDPAAQPTPAEGEDGEESTDVTTWGLAVGGVLNTGNTENFTINGGSRFRLVRLPHAIESEITYVLGLSNAGFADKTAENLNFRLRYDYFFDELNAVFIAGKLRQDDFAGLAPRLQGQVGYLRNLIYEHDGKSRFWGEIGYDLTYDHFNYDRLMVDPLVFPNVPDEQVTHSARLFLGYENTIDESLTFRTGLELLFNLNPDVVQTEVREDGTIIERVGLEDIRFNWDTALRVRIVGSLLAEVKFTMQFDNVPAAGAKKLDTLTQLNLVYNIF